MDLHNLWYVLAAILIVVGVVGTVLPALPGVPLVFAGMLVAAWADGFQHVGLWTLIGLGFVTAFLTALVVIRGLMKYLTKHGFAVFGYYRIALGLSFIALLYL